MGLLYPWCNLQLDCQTAGVFVGGDNTVRSEDDRKVLQHSQSKLVPSLRVEFCSTGGGGGRANV